MTLIKAGKLHSKARAGSVMSSRFSLCVCPLAWPIHPRWVSVASGMVAPEEYDHNSGARELKR